VQIVFMTNRNAGPRITEPGEPIDRTPDWRPVETWPEGDRVPGKGEMVTIDSCLWARVVEVRQTGPRVVEVYVAPGLALI
jgi:hypothetical protein